MSLLLDALKQAANSKTQTGKAPGKKASKSLSDSDAKTEKDDVSTTINSDIDTIEQQTKTNASDEITLELEEITEEHLQDSRLDTNTIEKPIDSTKELQKDSPKVPELEESYEEEPITIEMDRFDPDSLDDESDEHMDETVYVSSKAGSEPETQEENIDPKAEHAATNIDKSSETIKRPKTSSSEKEEPPNKADKLEKKNRIRAPENAKIILNPDKKPKRSGTFIVIGLLAIAVLAAGSFLGYLYYLEQDDQISSNIANLSRHPTAKIKPIDDLSTVSDEMAEVNKQAPISETANQTLQGSIAATAVQSDDKVGTRQTTISEPAATPELSAKPIGTVKTEQEKPLIQTQPKTQKSYETSAEELPPTLSSVINSHPFIEHTPLEQLPVAMEQPISIKKNNNEALASKNINLGYKQFEKGNYQLAKKYYQKALKLAPNDTDTFLGLAAIALIENDTNTAISLYTEVLQLDPQNTTAISAISTLYEKSKSDESTIKKNIEANPNNPWAYFNLGNHHMEEQNWTKALQAFSKANAIAPQTPDILFNIAISLDNLDRVQQAIEAYTMAISAAKNKPANFDAATVQKYVDSISLQNGNK